MRFSNLIFRSNRLFGFVLFLVSILKTGGAFAAEEPYVNSVRGIGVVQGASFDVTDEKFLSPSLFYGTIRPLPYSLIPENIVELKLNYDTSAFFYDKIFTATVNVTINCYNNPYDTSQFFTQYSNINLTIKHDTATGSPYKGVYFMKFTGAYKFRVIINSITCPELGTNMPKVLMVEGKTVIKRKYNFSTATTDVTKIEELPGQVRLSWIPANYSGAELFDLEYTVVDDSSEAGASVRNYLSTSTPIPPAFMDGLFRNNASRITIAASTYTLNPLYRAGYLLFRIRGVQMGNEYQSNLTASEQNLRSEGSWNYLGSKLSQPSYQYNVVQLQWHEPNLNWQYTISFAEEGKRKEVIGYFDGIFKNRQNVTLSNSDNKSIVQETVYDVLGRAAVNVLPVPTNDYTIHYFPNFNRNKQEKTYSYKDFAFGATCRTIPDTMSRTSGAHQYYSSSNNINDYFFKKYIPQAEGYPFTVTEYTADNTGRIFAQGGVGKDFQPGTNHETKFYYSKPTQEELDRLFGSEAGNASHHLKNMVVDPNGQISVSYLNASGKTIATALAGLTPNNVEALNTNNGTGVDVNKNLLLPQDFTKDYTANTLLGNSSFLAAVSGNYKFNYNLTPLRFDVLHGANNQFKICNTCYYDIVITVKDNCSQVLRTINRPVAANTVFQTDCNITPAPISDTFSIDIYNIGEYSVSYFLKVSETAFNFYDSVHLVQNTNIRSFNNFAIEKLNNSDFKGCFSECSTCVKELGTRTDFINNKVKPLFIQADSLVYAAEFDVWANSLYDSLVAHCNSIQSGCTVEAAPCDEEKEILLDDVSPGGQYALYDANYNILEPVVNVLDNRFGLTFTNEDGTPGMIEIDGVLYDAGSYSVSNKNFIENFNRGWAESLLQLHPEYCYYLWCSYGTNPNSKAFDNTITDIDDDSTAIAKGYFGSVASLLNNDPFFSYSGYGYPYYSQMLDSLNLFSRTIPGYSGPDFTILQYVDYELYCEEANIPPGSCTFPAVNDPCRSPYVEWQLYRDYYLNLKAYFNEKARLVNPSFATCKNCYVGTDNTEFLTCTAPPTSDFTIQLDPTYTTGKRIIVKYKNAEAAASHNLKLTISYYYGTVVQQFRAGRATELYIVPASIGDYYAVSLVECDTASGGGGQSRSIQSSKGGVQNSKQNFKLAIRSFDEPNSAAVGCPCPDYSNFSVYTSGYQCWDGGDEITVYYSGPEIPVGRTVYVDIYWYDYNTGNSGVVTVSFTNGQTVAYACINGGGVQNKAQQAKGVKISKNKTSEVAGTKKLPTPEALNKVQAIKDSLALKTNHAGKINGAEVAAAFPGDYYFYVQNVYCYDGPGFVCPGDGEPSSLCKDDPLYPYYKDKIRRYAGYQNPQGFYQNMSANYSNYQSQGQANQQADYLANCEAMADGWIYALRKCTPDENLLATIKAGLISVCQSGSNVDHPYGSSTNPSLTQSFESVIRQYLPNSTDSCTAELISDPYPYNRQPQYENKTLIKIDNCLTTRFSQLKTQYLNSGYTGTFHQWLQKQLKNDYLLSQQQLTDLEASINSGCKYLKRPLLLPVAFNCSSTAACIDSAATMQTHAAFLAKYPGITSSNENYQVLLTNYFNHTLAFNLNFEDYQSYLEKCQTGTTNKDLLCNVAPGSQLIVKEDVISCMGNVFNLAISQAVNEYTVYIDSVRTAFRNGFMAKCINVEPKLTMNAKLYEYHYTLYYYDQSGSLVKTIPPEGVKLLTDVQVAQVAANRLNTNNYCGATAPEINFTGSYLVNMPEEDSYIPTGGIYSTEAWVKLNNFNNQGIYSYNKVVYTSPTLIENGFSLRVVNGKLNFKVGFNNKLEVESPVLTNLTSTGNWFHLVIAINGTGVSMYVNGNKLPLTYLNNNSPSFILHSDYVDLLKLGGALEQNATTYMNGSIKQFRWYQRVLGIAEIQQNAFNNCFGASSLTGIACNLPLNEGTGNLVEDKATYTIGAPSSGNAAWLNYVTGIYPNHKLPTTYQYNSYNQVMRQNSPDGGTSSFWYDIMGRLVASQNAEQKTPKNTANSSTGRYSYTMYDAIGRISEVGEKYSGGTLIFEAEGGSYDTKSISSLTPWYFSGTDKQVTSTTYDQANTTVVTNTAITNLQTTNTRKRVVATIFKELKSNSYYDFATHYVYDINGNVKTLFQDLKPMRDVELVVGNLRGVRQINYEYDLVSGKVNKVIYAPGQGDQFIYRYDYDADNRLTDAYTSRNGLQWQKDAKYYYYLHGPMARTELGKYQVQGVDYAYTLQGWLKGINSQALDVNKDMAGDGNITSPTFKKFGRDVYGYSLGYHSNDYKPIGGATANAFEYAFTSPTGAVGTTGNTGSQLFNGNISNTTVALNKINNGQTTGYSYLYDQLNRLLGTRQHSISGTTWNYSGYNTAYEEKASYDANGNIKTYVRKGANSGSMPLAMDNLKYFYYYTNTSNIRSEYDPTQALPADVKTLTNQLAHVDDSDPASNYTADIDDQNATNYDYDNIGNLMKDNAEGITSINWTVYGKIKQIVKNTGVTINYGYDAAGNRVVKEVIGAPGGYNRQFYIRDAQGNTMAVYKDQSDYVNWMEQHLYGSSRIGVWNYGKSSPGIPGTVVYDSLMVGSVNYELSNHLQNVLVTISDKKIGVDNNSDGMIDYYTADVITANDYYPGGMLQPNRSFSSGNSYRYGFGGKEMDKDIATDNYDFGARIYDGRIGRWLSVDPLQKKYPNLSPYNFVANNPLLFIDPDGRDIILYDKAGKKVATITKAGTVIEKGMEKAAILQSYNATKNYLKDHTGDNIFEEFENDTKILNIKETNSPKGAANFKPAGKLGFKPETVTGTDDNGNKKLDVDEINNAEYESTTEWGTIEWNPSNGGIDAEGNRHSPALIFIHELKHGQHYKNNLVEFLKRSLKKLKGWDTEEEKKTIEETNEVSKSLKNGDGGDGDKKKRKSHGAKGLFKAKNSTSNENAPAKPVPAKKKLG